MLKIEILKVLGEHVLLEASSSEGSEFEWLGGMPVEKHTNLRIFSLSETAHCRLAGSDNEWFEFHLRNAVGEEIRKAAAQRGFRTGV